MKEQFITMLKCMEKIMYTKPLIYFLRLELIVFLNLEKVHLNQLFKSHGVVNLLIKNVNKLLI